jgi:hypothetical protein
MLVRTADTKHLVFQQLLTWARGVNHRSIRERPPLCPPHALPDYRNRETVWHNKPLRRSDFSTRRAQRGGATEAVVECAGGAVSGKRYPALYCHRAPGERFNALAISAAPFFCWPSLLPISSLIQGAAARAREIDFWSFWSARVPIFEPDTVSYGKLDYSIIGVWPIL